MADDEVSPELQALRDKQRAALGLPPADYGSNIRRLGSVDASPDEPAAPPPAIGGSASASSPGAVSAYLEAERRKRTTNIVGWSIGIGVVLLVGLGAVFGTSDDDDDDATPAPGSASESISGASVPDQVLPGQAIVDWYNSNGDAFEELADAIGDVSDASSAMDMAAIEPACLRAWEAPDAIDRNVPDPDVRAALDAYLDVVLSSMSQCYWGVASGQIESLESAAARSQELAPSFRVFADLLLQKAGIEP